MQLWPLLQGGRSCPSALLSHFANMFSDRTPFSPSRSRASAKPRVKRLGIEPLERREMLSFSSLLQSLFSSSDRYERDDAPAQARNIATDGSAQTHSLHKASDVDWVMFKLTENSNVVIQTSGLYGDTELWLYGPDNSSTQIAYANDTGGSRFARLELRDSQALNAGTYYVKVGEFGRDEKILRYLLSVNATPVPASDAFETDDTAASAKPIAVDGGPQTHTLHVGADVDWVKFNLVTQTDVVIETRGATGDTRISLFSITDTVNPIASDDDGGKGDFSRILRFGQDILTVGSYYLKVEAADQLAIASYTLTVTALQPGDIFLEHAEEGLSAAIRLGESKDWASPSKTPTRTRPSTSARAKSRRCWPRGTPSGRSPSTSRRPTWWTSTGTTGFGTFGADVAKATRSYANTPYAFSELAVLGLAAVNPNNPNRVKRSLVYQAYARFDAGVKRMTCSELVVRAYAAVDPSLAIDAKLWPTMAALGNSSADFAMDFTTPTMLSLSIDLRRLNA